MQFSRWLVASCAVVVVVGAGCEQRQPVVPVRGKVLYKGVPLKSGSVMFQPEAGIPASGNIGADGTFVMSTYDEGDGATPGVNKVRVVSTDAVGDDSQVEGKIGASLIPSHYNNFGTTPLTFEVKAPGEESAVLELKD